MRIRIRDLFDQGSGKENFGSGINIPDLRNTVENLAPQSL